MNREIHEATWEEEKQSQSILRISKLSAASLEILSESRLSILSLSLCLNSPFSAFAIVIQIFIVFPGKLL